MKSAINLNLGRFRLLKESFSTTFIFSLLFMLCLLSHQNFLLLKKELLIHHQFDCSKFPSIILYFTNQISSHKPREANAFTSEDLNTFIINHYKKEYLVHILVILFALFGGLQPDETTFLEWKDVSFAGDYLKFILQKSKTDKKKNGNYFLSLHTHQAFQTL